MADLFRIESDGYRREDVDAYIEKLKAEYKKVYDYAKATQANNEKLKTMCRALKEKNDALKSKLQ